MIFQIPKSGNAGYHGSATKQGSKMLGWAMIDAAIVPSIITKRCALYQRVKHRRVIRSHRGDSKQNAEDNLVHAL
jgi:hypothetical protein